MIKSLWTDLIPCSQSKSTKFSVVLHGEMCNAQTLITLQVSLDSHEATMITMYHTCTVVDPVCMLSLIYPCAHSASDHVRNVIYSHIKKGKRGIEMSQIFLVADFAVCAVISILNPHS